jgi:hypothetical protein
MRGADFDRFAIAKSDSSIRPAAYGMELVTVPASLTALKQIFKHQFFGTKLNQRFTVNSSCGMHVHISKKAFTRHAIGKFLTFFNADENDEFITYVAGRPPNAYTTKWTLDPVDDEDGERFSGGISESSRRYKSFFHLPFLRSRSLMEGNRVTEDLLRGRVNLRKAKTVEIRMFASTLQYERLIGNIEFCDAVVKFFRETPASKLAVHDFLDFLLKDGNRTRYFNLLSFLEKGGWVRHKRVRNKRTGKYTKRFMHLTGPRVVPGAPAIVFTHNPPAGDVATPLNATTPLGRAISRRINLSATEHTVGTTTTTTVEYVVNSQNRIYANTDNT